MKTPEEIQELAIAKYGTGIYSIDEIDAYVVGYTQCQNDMAIQTMSNGKRRVAPFKQDSMNLVWENGYQMALLDNKDKVFSYEDMINLISYLRTDKHANLALNCNVVLATTHKPATSKDLFDNYLEYLKTKKEDEK